VTHPYPPYCRTFTYIGRHRYLLTFVTYDRIEAFTSAATVALVWLQFLRAAREIAFEVVAYSFMPDHVHLVVEGTADDSDLKRFAKLAKQSSGYDYARAHAAARLWQKGKHDHIIRDDADLLDRVRYVVNNPIVAGLVTRPEDYPFTGSQRWSKKELIKWCRTGMVGERGERPSDVDFKS
jgi:putative transposase